MFVGYPKRTKGYVFYSPSDNKMFVSTNTRFLEEDFMKNAKIQKQAGIRRIIGRWVFDVSKRNYFSTDNKRTADGS